MYNAMKMRVGDSGTFPLLSDTLFSQETSRILTGSEPI